MKNLSNSLKAMGIVISLDDCNLTINLTQLFEVAI